MLPSISRSFVLFTRNAVAWYVPVGAAGWLVKATSSNAAAGSLSALRLTTAPRESVISTSTGSPVNDDFQSAVRTISPRCVVSPGR